MNVPELIRRKREGLALEPAELEAFVRAYVAGQVEDYQVSAFLMAVFFRGMEPGEAAGLTRAMRDSGRRFDLSAIPGPKVDKHSTGGVGDKVSLVLAPLVAAAGLVDPMVSGRGLGHSGGTLDKLDSIPGYRWALSEDEFKAQLAKVGCAIIGQTDDFVPADKKLYALRDVTATVESIPLICASILSKKCASGAEALAMDVKCGSGAFMRTLDDARALARQLVSIGTELGLRMSALVTQMGQPLGRTVGNALEVVETVEVLRGGGPGDTREITLRLGAEMLVLGGLDDDIESAHGRLAKLLDDGTALDKFREWVAAQGGDPRVADDPEGVLPAAPDQKDFAAPSAGHLAAIDTRAVGVAGNLLGAGRMKTTDTVDPAVGFEVLKRVGDRVEAGEPLLRIHHAGGRGLAECEAMLASAFEIGDGPVEPLELVLDRIG